MAAVQVFEQTPAINEQLRDRKRFSSNFDSATKMKIFFYFTYQKLEKDVGIFFYITFYKNGGHLNEIVAFWAKIVSLNCL